MYIMSTLLTGVIGELGAETRGGGHVHSHTASAAPNAAPLTTGAPVLPSQYTRNCASGIAT
jgi:hypothetical protein